MKIFKTLFGLGLVLFLANTALAQDWAGKITEAQGQVSVVRSGQSLVSKLGSGILPGDEIVTGANSRAKVWFKDESVITLAEKSRFRVDALEYNPGLSRRSIYTLVSGKAKAMVSGWFGSSPEQQYQIKALSTVAGVRGTEFIVQINGEGKNASAFFATITGTVVLWNVDRPEQKLTLPADFFIEVLNGGVPGAKQNMGPEIFEQFNQGFFVIEARGLRGEIILQVVQFNISMPSGPGGPVVINVIPTPGAESNRTDYLSPTDSLLTGNVIPPTGGGGGGGGGGGPVIPPGSTSIQIKIDPSDLNR